MKDKKNNNKQIPVPCGKCPECVKRRVSGWSFRLMQEEKRSDSAYFITLTYEDKRIHKSHNGYMGLTKRNLQLFFKRLRKAHVGAYDGKRIKYYAVGEYGGRSMRPHYHIILFNSKLELMFSKEDLKLLQYSKYDGKEQVRCIQWDKGHVTVGRVTGASVGYTLKYISKKSKVPLHKNDDRQPEFSLMSKGLGEGYLTDQMCDWHKKDLLNRMYINVGQGKKAAMPRYYKDRIYDSMERSEIAGYHKGEMEKKLDKLEKEITIDQRHEQVEGHKAAFKKMHKSAEKNRVI